VHSNLHVFENGHGVKQPNILKRSGDTLTDDTTAHHVVDFLALIDDCAFAGRIDSGNHVENRSLTGAVRAYQTEDSAGGDLKIKVVDS
jgi:hypothetical protein